MNIKEVEKEVGIRKANIRYYEEQGLVTPMRNAENNYRDYSEEDVICLKKIKVLRLLGISVAEIKAVQNRDTALNTVVQSRISEIKKEVEQLGELEEMCRMFLAHDQTYDTLDISLLDTRECLSIQKGAVFMKIDRCRNYQEALRRSEVIMTCFIFLGLIPTGENVQRLFHYSLPEWIRWIGFAGACVTGIINIVLYRKMYSTQKKDWERAEENLAAKARRS
ncbi:MerR family transcriptional regulator [Faecalicatena orotica]|uniref:MerR family transcriptional regulator n=1 Tax=Faecalicatena orotica TaxID=1544 RepID=UPI0032179736